MFFSLLFSCVVFFVGVGENRSRSAIYPVQDSKEAIADSPMFEEYGHAQTMPVLVMTLSQYRCTAITLNQSSNQKSACISLDTGKFCAV